MLYLYEYKSKGNKHHIEHQLRCLQDPKTANFKKAWIGHQSFLIRLY